VGQILSGQHFRTAPRDTHSRNETLKFTRIKWQAESPNRPRSSLLTGNPGRRKLNKSEPKAPPGTPEMPWYLTPEAKEEWERIVPLLARVPGLLSRIDGTALGSYCMAFARWIEAEEEISQHGVLVKEPCFDRQGRGAKSSRPMIARPRRSLRACDREMKVGGIWNKARQLRSSQT
jgi:P27 family predicted phage terminase small subunit